MFHLATLKGPVDMSHHQQGPGVTIAEVYKSVINDVIGQVKEAFLDESVDIEVLQQLKKEWEDRLRQSGAVDLDGPRPQPVAPPMRGQMMARPMPVPIPQGVRIQQSTQQLLHQHQQQAQHMQQQHTHQQQVEARQPQPINVQQYTIQQPGQMGQLQTLQVQGMPGMQQFHGMQQMRMVTAQGGHPQVAFVTQHGGQMAQPVMIIGGNQQLLTANNMMQQRVVLQQQPQQQHMQEPNPIRQLDGNDGDDEQEDEPSSSALPSSSNAGPTSLAQFRKFVGPLPKPTRVKGKELKELMERFKDIIQIDGNGMSDSSSEDENDDDDDPYHRIVDRIDDPTVDEDGEQVNEEASLNSGDDQTDDEDLNTLFDAENVVMCQFEKVHRARQKWKFSLKDGIMHIDGKDYCFQKCTGEAEW